MSEKEISVGRLSFKLYNKKDATHDEIKYAINLINKADVDKLDIYGKFVWAQMVLDDGRAIKTVRAKAFELMLELTKSKDIPKSLLVGAYCIIGRSYEFGIGVEKNRHRALENYIAANKLNPKVCQKEIARVELSLNPPKPPRETDTPYEYQYRFSVKEADDDAIDEHLEAVYDYRSEMSDEHLRRMEALKRTGFYYADEPELINLSDLDMYCVDGVTKEDLLRAKNKPMRLDEYDEYGYGDDYVDENPPESLFVGLYEDDPWWECDDSLGDIDLNADDDDDE